MTEQQIVDYIKNLIYVNKTNTTQVARKAGYIPQTLYYWFRYKTRITLDGLTCVLAVFDRKPAIKDKKGLHVDILAYLPTLVKGNEEKVYALFDCKENARSNLRKWSSGVNGIKVYRLIEILDAVGAELVIVKKKGE